MKKHDKDALKYLVNRIYLETGVTKKQTMSVLGFIADMRWDWEGKKYDFYGINIERLLADLGEDRCPLEKIENLT